MAQASACAYFSNSRIAAAVRLIRAGKICAVKGLGGYHLACDARCAPAVTALRERNVGDAVNLEADLIGKYVEKFVTSRAPG